MSNHQTDELTRALRERSDGMSGTHVAFEDVKGRARGIRRRRRATGGVVAAAVVLAIGVPLGINVNSIDRGHGPIQPANPSPSVVETPEEPNGPVVIDAAAAPRGEDPALTYLTGTTLHRPDGPDVELSQQYSWVAPYADGWLGFSGADGTTTILDGQGNPVGEPYPGMSGAIASDGSRLATWVDATGGVDLALWPRDGAPPDEGYTSNVVALEGDMQLAGFVGPEAVAYNLTVSDNQGATQKPYVTDWTSEPRELTSVIDVRGANDVSGVVSGMTEIDDVNGRYCAAVVRAETDTVVWDTCEYRLGKFSPDGRYVLGVDPQSDGLGSQGVTILDAEDGDVVAELTLPRGSFMQDTIWESRSTILTPVMQDGSWYLLRLRPDGTVEKALDPVPGGNGYDDSSPWRFAVTP